MYDSKSGSEFLERIGCIPTLRTPVPAIEPGAFKVHTLHMETPLPLPPLVASHDGEPEPPDRGVTQAWPPQV